MSSCQSCGAERAQKVASSREQARTINANFPPLAAFGVCVRFWLSKKIQKIMMHTQAGKMRLCALLGAIVKPMK